MSQNYTIVYQLAKFILVAVVVCPVCPTAGALGGYLGGYFGINPPERPELRVMSALITTSMTVITVVALRCLFGISICDGNGDFSLRNIAQVGTMTLLLGIIYSIAVNYLLRQLFPESSQNEAQNESSCPCHCKNEKNK